MKKRQCRKMQLGAIVLGIVIGFIGCKKEDFSEGRKSIPPSGFVYIPSGNFSMGSSLQLDSYAQKDETPQHDISMSGFYLSTKELTVGQFKKFVEAGYDYDTIANKPTWLDGSKSWLSDAHPMVNISWRDVAYYCNWLSEKEGLRPCYIFTGVTVKTDFSNNGYRLPTEAEWEYACRAGQIKPYTVQNQGKDTILLTEANYGNIVGKTTPVGSYAPNAFGLYDMHGNVWEWCNDVYDSTYYSKPEARQPNPQGPTVGIEHTIRGGWWNRKAYDMRSSNRYPVHFNYRGFDIGCRIAKSL